MFDESESVLVLTPQVRENISEEGMPMPENFDFSAAAEQAILEPFAQPREWRDEFEMVPAAVSEHYKDFLNLKEFYRVDRYKLGSPYERKKEEDAEMS